MRGGGRGYDGLVPRPEPLRLCFLAAALALAVPASAGHAGDPGPRHPSSLDVDPSGRWILVANEESGSLSVLDAAAGRVAGELSLDPRGRPSAIACRADDGGRVLAAVVESFTHSVAIAACEPRADGSPDLSLRGRVTVGRLPADVLFAGRRLLVACEGADEIHEVDPDALRLTRRIPGPGGARRLAVFSDGGAARVAVAGRTAVEVIDLESGRKLISREPCQGTARNIDGILVRGDSIYIAHQIQPTEGPTDPQMLDWGLILANRVTAIASKGDARELAIPLDTRGRASGDPARIDLVAERDLLLVPSAGTGRVLLVNAAEEARGRSITRDDGLPSIPVGGRPVQARAAPGGRTAYVAEYLGDAVLEIGLEERKVLRKIPLGPTLPETPELAGARIYFDATRSRGDWYSCQSCHPGGGTAGHSFNTLADGRGLAKRSPDLRGTADTGPWSWLGRFESLEEQVASSLKKTMAADDEPAHADVAAVTAYLKSLRRPEPARSTPPPGDPARGAAVFETAGCGGCPTPPAFTSEGLHDLGLPEPIGRGTGYNPPSLRGVGDRGRLLHDGRADSIEAVFRKHDPERRHGRGASLGDGELSDLVAYVRTL